MIREGLNIAGKSLLAASEEQRVALRGLAESRDRGEADRAHAVLLTLAGWTSPRIAELASLTRPIQISVSLMATWPSHPPRRDDYLRDPGSARDISRFSRPLTIRVFNTIDPKALLERRTGTYESLTFVSGNQYGKITGH
jgi:hypothetical protein